MLALSLQLSWSFITIMKNLQASTPRIKLATAAVMAASVFALIAGCANTDTRPEVTHDGLEAVTGTKFGDVYAKPGVDLSSYSKFTIDTCDVAFKKNWQRDQNSSRVSATRRVSDSDVQGIRDALSALCLAEFVAALQAAPAYPMVTFDAADTQTLVLTPSIINLNISAPDVKSPGMSRSYTTNNTGEMTLYLELSDASTGEILYRIIDRRRSRQSFGLQWTNSVTNTADAKRILEQWSAQLREGVDHIAGQAGMSGN